MNKDDCQGCQKEAHCNTPCLYLDIIRRLSGEKNKPLMERLAPPDTTDDRHHRKDYKQSLIEQQNNKLLALSTTIKEIRDIPDTNRKAIAAMLYADMTIKEVSFIMDKSERTIKRLCGLP